jgi:hypothetical protein
MDPPLAFGPIDGGTVFAGTHVSGGCLNVTINGSRREAFVYNTAAGTD